MCKKQEYPVYYSCFINTDTVKAVCLPIGNMANVNLTNKGAIITGWGATEKGKQLLCTKRNIS